MNGGRILVFIIDGLGDRPIRDFGDRTPLETASTPRLDLWAQRGETGLVDPIAPGIRAGSDTSHLALLGYDPHEYYTGRGPFEAAGVGMDVRPGDVAFRCNFATVEEKDGRLVVVDRRADRIQKGTADLAAEFNGLAIDGVTVLVKESTAHRAALVLRGEGLGAAVTDADPHDDGRPVVTVTGESDADKKTAAVVNKVVQLSYEKFKDHPVNKDRVAHGKNPANVLLPRGAGLAPHIPSFPGRWGFKAAAVVEVGLIRGIARYCGLDVVMLPAAVNGGLDTDLAAIFAATQTALQTHDFVLMNVKGADVAGHDGDAAAKLAFLERLDDALEAFIAALPGGLHVAVLGDHSTPVAVGDHSGDPVPLILLGPGVRPDATTTFGERPCATGGAGRLRGLDLLPILLNLAGWAEKYGA